MDPSIIAQLETAAAIIMVKLAKFIGGRIFEALFWSFQAPPNQVKSEERHQAEAVFISFRNSKGVDALKMCQCILGKSGNSTKIGGLRIFRFQKTAKSIWYSSRVST